MCGICTSCQHPSDSSNPSAPRRKAIFDDVLFGGNLEARLLQLGRVLKRHIERLSRSSRRFLPASDDSRPSKSGVPPAEATDAELLEN
jgi:hypothetical protein